MTDFLHDPDLDRLVADLNRDDETGEPEATAELPGAVEKLGPRTLRLIPPARLTVSADEPLERLLAEMVRREASDLHLLAGSAPVLRKDGGLARLEMPALDDEALRRLFEPHLGEVAQHRFETEGATDVSLRLDRSEVGGWRFRVNLHRQRGRLAATVRALPRKVPTLDELHLPPELAELVATPRGLVLVTGPAGSGKTTTLAALVEILNRERSLHILTVEDPVEYEHVSKRSVVEQLELGVDTPSFAHALKAAMRQDPDVILVGEMRDLETMAGALTAAETGHLLLATLHTNDVAHAVHRIVDVFDSRRQEQIRQQLAMTLHAIVCQQLVPRADGRGRVPAVEILRGTYPVRHHIRKNQLQKIYNEIARGRAEGMVSMEVSLQRLVEEGRITAEEARVRSLRPDEMRSLLGG